MIFSKKNKLGVESWKTCLTAVRLAVQAYLLFSVNCFSQTDSLGITDYSIKSNWAALPDMTDFSDETPTPSLRNLQDSAEVDVFYVHPTTYVGFEWNSKIENQTFNRLTDKFPIQQQASVFNESCKIYAPRYRQANVVSFVTQSDKADTALEFAYRDVKKAFEYYLENYNKGRPIVIAAHSQGSRHAVQLLKDFFDGKTLANRLVIAYIPGWIVKCDEFKKIAVCENEFQNGCFVSWNSVMWGVNILTDITKDACCTNPLSWKHDTVYAPKEKHKGSVPATFNKIDEKAIDAKVQEGKLWVHLPADPRYWISGLNYHVLDYNLFLMDIRENVKLRIENYFEGRKMNDYR